MISLESQYITELHRFRDELRQRNLTPWQYCQRWVPLLYGIHDSDPSFKKQCYAELSRITGTEVETIANNWHLDKEKNEVPRYAYVVCRLQDEVNFFLYNARFIPRSKELLPRLGFQATLN